MSEHVTLVNEYGDIQHGILHHLTSDEPPVIRVGSTELYVHVWRARGWAVKGGS